jgi:antitoxin component YwqK of YwqJK toxin-antitoxin module
MENNKYKNGQVITEKNGDELTYYFKDGKVKAQGKYIDGNMEGTWIFNRATGELWQEGNFLGNVKHGKWIRYDKKGNVEYNEEFINGKQVK